MAQEPIALCEECAGQGLSLEVSSLCLNNILCVHGLGNLIPTI